MSRQDEDRQVEMTVSSDWMQLVDQRLTAVEAAAKKVETNTAAVVAAFEAAQGAFKVLEWLGKVAKPLLWIGGVGVFGVATLKAISHTSFGRFFVELFGK